MEDLEAIIKHEGECTYVDFKESPYHETKRSELIKDVMSMASASHNGSRYIIIGVGFKKRERQLTGITKTDFPDTAQYQQLIRDNVEPEIPFEVLFISVDGKDFAVLRIAQCDNAPYVMKKEFGQLRKGDMWIRVGDHNTRLLRPDLERIYKERFEKARFNGRVRITFGETKSSEIYLPALENFERPSDIEKKKIEQELAQRRNPLPPPEEDSTDQRLGGWVGPSPDVMKSLARAMSNPFSIESSSTEELERKLQSVESDFAEDNLFSMFEEHGQRINVIISNEGDQFLEDVLITIDFPKKDILMAKKIYKKSPRGPFGGTDLLNIASPYSPRYPRVEYLESSIIVTEHIEKIRHFVPTDAFDLPLRVVFSPNLIGQIIEVTCKISSSTLPKPYTQSLKIHVIDHMETQ